MPERPKFWALPLQNLIFFSSGEKSMIYVSVPRNMVRTALINRAQALEFE